MASLKLEKVRKSFGAVTVLHGIDLQVEKGEFVVFVGPSGCGKSTLLRVIAGLEEISAGTLKIDGTVVNAKSPKERGIAMVFQSYALYPHMSVYDNMAFGLKLEKGAGKADVDARVREAARVLQIEDYLDRLPKALSGGQRQRVAIGRAITRDPKVFLFDEPLSNLDAALRVQTRIEIARLHEKMAGTTMIYVTHDQVEAMTLADRIVILNKGRIEQVGSPIELYERPGNLFVARFIGSPSMNVLPAKLDVSSDSIAATLDGGEPLELSAGKKNGAKGSATRSGRIDGSLGIRPEDLALAGHEAAMASGDMFSKDADATFVGALRGEVTLVERLGEVTLVHVDLGGRGEPVVAKLPGGPAVTRGETVTLRMRRQAIHLFDKDGKAIRLDGRS